jgi:hypothetical protein
MNNETQQQPVNRNWFSEPEIKAAMAEMQFSEQKELLIALTGSRTWIAILSYLKDRYEVVQGALSMYDPVKEPTLIARCQGTMQGLLDLPGVMGQVLAEIKEKEKSTGAENIDS